MEVDVLDNPLEAPFLQRLDLPSPRFYFSRLDSSPSIRPQTDKSNSNGKSQGISTALVMSLLRGMECARKRFDDAIVRIFGYGSIPHAFEPRSVGSELRIMIYVCPAGRCRLQAPGIESQCPDSGRVVRMTNELTALGRGEVTCNLGIGRYIIRRVFGPWNSRRLRHKPISRSIDRKSEDCKPQELRGT
jgi:hypothetical protein